MIRPIRSAARGALPDGARRPALRRALRRAVRCAVRRAVRSAFAALARLSTVGTLGPRRASSSSLALAVAALVLALAACSGGDTAATAGAPGAGEADFRLASLDGERQIGPRDFRDQVVLVDFWATWCVPCHAQAEVLAGIYRDLAADQVEFLAVDVGEQAEQVRSFVDRRPFPYPVLLDPDSELADSLGINSLPTLMVIDRAGKVTYFAAGVRSESELRHILEAAGV